jgi:hypothetical protein
MKINRYMMKQARENPEEFRSFIAGLRDRMKRSYIPRECANALAYRYFLKWDRRMNSIRMLALFVYDACRGEVNNQWAI